MSPPAIRLDIHAHLIPLREEDVVELAGIAWSPRDRLVVDGNELKKPELYDPAALLAWMDRHGVAQAWVSVPPTLYRAALDADPARGWADALNAAMVRILAPHAPRLSPLVHLPVQHPALAVDLVREAVDRGQRRFAMSAGDAGRGLMLSDEAYQPLWSALNEAEAFLFLHPGRACDARLERFSLSNLLGGPVETAMAAVHLAMSGTLERFDRMTVCLAHGGGVTAAVAGRVQRGQDTGREGAYLGGEKLRSALRRLCVDCITHDAAALDLVASTFGADRVLFGSDWPFDMGLGAPHEQLSAVSPALRARIFDNEVR